MQELSSSVEIIYEEKAGYLYLLAPNKITYAELSQDGIKERVQVDTLLQADYEYLPADNILVYINADGTLCYSEKGKKKRDYIRRHGRNTQQCGQYTERYYLYQRRCAVLLCIGKGQSCKNV